MNGLDVDIRGLMLMLWRRRFLVLGTVLVGVSLAMIMISTLTPRYSASSKIMISADSSIPESLKPLVRGKAIDSTVVLNEIEILRSRALAKHVIEAYNLYTDPVLNPKFEAFQQSKGARFKTIRIETDNKDIVSADSVQMSRVITNFLNMVTVRAVPGTFVVDVVVSAPDPKRAAFLANAIAKTYIERRLSNKFDASEKVSGWLDNRLNDLKAQVGDAERAVGDYRAENNITMGAKADAGTVQISTLNRSIASAKTKRAEAQAKLEQLKTGRLSEDDSSLIERLKLRESGQSADVDELATRYGPKHPVMIKKRSELKATRRQLNQEIANIKSGIKNDAELATAELGQLEDGMKDVAGETFLDEKALVGLRALEREAESSRRILDSFLETYKRGGDQKALQEAGAEIISYAAMPRASIFPNVKLMISLSMVMSLFAGMGLAVVLESLDNTYRTAKQLEDEYGLPCYGLIPFLKGAKDRKKLGQYVLTHPASVLAESIKTVRAVFKLNGDGDMPKTIAVTSSFPEEGKSTLSLWIARSAAKSGMKTVLIDCDLRRPSIHGHAGIKNTHSLVDVLTDRQTVDTVIQKDTISDLDIICGNTIPNTALDLLSSSKMNMLMAKLQQDYDLVILDTPASLAVADARVLAVCCDLTLYAV